MRTIKAFDMECVCLNFKSQVAVKPHNYIMRVKKVFVSGCFDMLHSGHVRFLEEAASYGELHVGIGSDQTVVELKGRYPVNTQAEREYMIKASLSERAKLTVLILEAAANGLLAQLTRERQ